MLDVTNRADRETVPDKILNVDEKIFYLATAVLTVSIGAIKEAEYPKYLILAWRLYLICIGMHLFGLLLSSIFYLKLIKVKKINEILKHSRLFIAINIILVSSFAAATVFLYLSGIANLN